MGILAAYSSIWKGGRFETLFAGVFGSINLNYYDDASNAEGALGLGYNLKLSGAVARGRYRIPDSKFYVGLKYMLLSVESGFRSESSSVEASAELIGSDRPRCS